MKIQQLLEGVIRVPSNVIDQAMATVCADILSRVMTALHQDADNDNNFELIAIYKRIIAQMQKKYGTFDVLPDYSDSYHMKNKIYLSMKDLPKGYVKNKKNSNKEYLINIRTKFLDNPNQIDPSAEYYKKGLYAKSALIVVYIPDMAIHYIIKKPEYFDVLIKQYEGAVEHELTHAIQDIAFNVMPDELNYYVGTDNIDYDKYYSHEIEYDPLLKSEAKNFIAHLAKIRIAGYKPSASEIKNIAMKYVGASTNEKLDYQPNAGVSNYFITLKRIDLPKWKKAVKYFYGLVQSELKF